MGKHEFSNPDRCLGLPAHFGFEGSLYAEEVVASIHPYLCVCPLCEEFWKRNGPDPENGTFGPFETAFDDTMAQEYNMLVEAGWTSEDASREVDKRIGGNDEDQAP